MSQLLRVREFNGGRTVYFKELNGHLLEIRTRTSVEDIAAGRAFSKRGQDETPVAAQSGTVDVPLSGS